MSSHSRFVSSNQISAHPKLETIVSKHLTSTFLRPIATHNIRSFDQIFDKIEHNKIIFDSGCGNGKSTVNLAKLHPDAFVLGIDKSSHRLNHFDSKNSNSNNFALIRADLIDIFRLANQHSIRLYKHYILYPNPWPKKQHFARRWHGSPVFKNILALGGDFELRSNWSIYLEEFAIALNVANFSSQLSTISFTDEAQPISDFEAKYHQSGHQLQKLTANLNVDSAPR